MPVAASSLLAAVAALALLTGCGGEDVASRLPDPCPPTCPGTAAPLPPPTGTDPPEGSAAYDALVVAPEPGELARGGNDADASATSLVVDVVVPAGARLRSHTVCQGRTSVTVTTDPPSAAESDLACGEGVPDEVVVEEQQAHGAPQAFHVTVTAPAPVRWYAVLSAVPGDPGPAVPAGS